MLNQTTPENVVDINSYLAQPISSSPKPASSADISAKNVADLAQTNKKLVTVVMGMTIMIGLVACIAYLAGRAMTIARSNGSQPVIQRAAQLPIVVDSPKVMTPKSDSPIALPTQAVVAVPANLPKNETKTASVPVTGTWYVQVGYIEKDQAGAFRRDLEQKGFTSFAIAGDTPTSNRILLGPLADPIARAAMQQRLKMAGFESFQRRY